MILAVVYHIYPQWRAAHHAISAQDSHYWRHMDGPSVDTASRSAEVGGGVSVGGRCTLLAPLVLSVPTRSHSMVFRRRRRVTPRTGCLMRFITLSVNATLPRSPRLARLSKTNIVTVFEGL